MKNTNIKNIKILGLLIDKMYYCNIKMYNQIYFHTDFQINVETKSVFKISDISKNCLKMLVLFIKYYKSKYQRHQY